MKRTFGPTSTYSSLTCVPEASIYLVAVIDPMIYYPETFRENEIWNGVVLFRIPKSEFLIDPANTIDGQFLDSDFLGIKNVVLRVFIHLLLQILYPFMLFNIKFFHLAFLLSLRGRFSIPTELNQFVCKGGDASIHPPPRVYRRIIQSGYNHRYSSQPACPHRLH